MPKTQVKNFYGSSGFSPSDKVKVKKCGNVVSVSSTHSVFFSPCERLDKDTYIYLPSGEKRQIKHNTSRASDLQSVARSLALGRDILNSNITDVSFCRWLTLTYADNMTDSKKLLYDFQNFNKLCRRQYGHYEYVVAAEPQGRGAWHLHCVLIFPGKAPYMPNADIAKLWGKGFVTIKRLDDVDNVGAYLTAYLGDMELSEAEKTDVPESRIKTVDYIDDDGKQKSKRYIKGGRLHMYPPGFRMFRFSRGIKRPEIKRMYYKDFCEKEKASSGKLTFAKRVEYSSDSFVSSIGYEYYNKARK